MNFNSVKYLRANNENKHINPAHFSEWVDGSGVDPEITRLSLTSLTSRTVIAMRLGWKKYLDSHPLGWWLSGLDLSTMRLQTFGQFKPDERVRLSAEDEEGSKYISAKGEYDAIALQHPDKDYWQRIIDDPSLPIALDEGGKKAGLLMTLDFPALALCGVTMGLQKGGKNLVKNLELLAVQGRPITVVYDSDLATNPNVQQALKALATVLKRKGCILYVAIIPLELGCKGIDDVWAKHGPEMVKKIMADAIPYSQWLKNLEAQMGGSAKNQSSEKASSKPPSPRKTAAEIAEQYASSCKFDNEQKTWRIWNGKCWQKTEIGAFTSLLKTTLDAKNIDYAGIEYIENTRKLLECDLRQVRWQTWDKTRYISFNNCVFDGVEAKILPHSPGMGFTSHLPYDYKPFQGNVSDPLEALRVNCPKTHQFFRTAMQNDERKMFKLLAIVNAVLKHRFFDLQMFVHFVGAPGSGKGKCARFLQKLVGKDNTIACQLDKLGDGSTKASVIDKQLVVFPDERKPVGIDSILSLTGGDEISYRELYQRATSAHFYGSLIICSNKPIFIGDTTGLERRLCLVGFDNPIATEKRDHSLEAELDSEIPACIAIALSLTNSAVTQAIQGIGANQIAEYKAKEWEMKVEVNSVAAFLDAALVLDPTATTTVGNLYDAYKEFCEDGGLSKFSITKFPRLLADILADENLPGTRHQGRIAYFEGLRLRTKADTHPTHSETLAGLGAGLSGTLAGLGAGLEPLPDIHQRDLRDLDTKLPRRNANDYLPDEEESDKQRELPPSSPASPANPLAVPDTSPAQVPQVTPTSPANVGTSHKEFKEGDRVVIAEVGSIHQGQHGEVVYVGHGSRETDYIVKLDKESRGSKQVRITVPKGSKFTFLMKL
jgi:putative DNA primase/helicase